jgi:hypothetical protein
MNHIRNTVTAVAAVAVLGLFAGCGDVEAPANDIGSSVDKKKEGPAPKAPVRTNPHRMDFGDGEATLPAKPEGWTDDNPSRLDFGDDGRA